MQSLLIRKSKKISNYNTYKNDMENKLRLISYPKTNRLVQFTWDIQTTNISIHYLLKLSAYKKQPVAKKYFESQN
jgi:hypothetical protein